jgi:hypothetical protein
MTLRMSPHASVFQDEVWIRVKMDQMTAQFVSCCFNHESSILIDNWTEEKVYAAFLERTDMTNQEVAALLQLTNQSGNSSFT